MEGYTAEHAKAAIEQYYKQHLATGVAVEVSNCSMKEMEGEKEGKIVTATVAFLKSTTGGRDSMKISMPCDGKGNLDWTNVTMSEEKEVHNVDPSKTSHPEVKSPATLPANNQKPKAGGGQPPEDVTYIQKPEKVGSQGGKKIKAPKESKAIRHPRVLGTDPDGWPTPDQLALEEQQEERRRQMEAAGADIDDGGWGDDLDPLPEHGGGEDFDVFQEAGIDSATAQRMLESKAPRSQPKMDGYAFDQDTEVDMRGIKGITERDGKQSVALVEFNKKVAVEGTSASLFEFGLLFEDEDTRNDVKSMLEGIDGIESIEENEDIGLVVVSRQDESATDPTTPFAMVTEAIGIAFMHDSDENEKKLDEAIEETHNYNDNSGQYNNGVKTDANEPGQPMGEPSKEDEPEQGGPRKRKHKGAEMGDQGGDGLGGQGHMSAPSTPLSGGETSKGGQKESKKRKVAEQEDFLDDVMSYEGGDDEGDDVGDMADEFAAEEETEAEIDDTLMSIIAAQAHHGLEMVLQVAREQAEAEGGELTPETEEAIREMFAEMAQEEQGGEDEMAVASMEVTAVGDFEDEENGEDDEEDDNPGYFESQNEDVNISINDGGSAEVTATDGGASSDPAPEPVAPPAEAADVTAEPEAEVEETEESDDDEEEGDDDETEEVDESVNPWISAEQMEHICPDCAEYMRENKITRVRASALLDEDSKEAKNNPWAICTAEVGREDKDKYERCVQRVKKQHGESKKGGSSLNEETPLSGLASRVAGWASNQPAPGDNLSFTPDGAYSFKQRIAKRDPSKRVAQVLKPGKFSPTTSRHSNMVARGLARQGYQVDRVDAIDGDTKMGIGQVNQQMGLELPVGAMESLSGVRFDAKKLEALTDEQKGKLKEKLLVHAKKLSEDQANPYTMGGPQSWQRVKGKERSYNMFGRIKPDTKWHGMVRVVWDDGHESWEKSSDLQNVGANVYNVASPSGGPAKPADTKLTQQGGEEYDMLKSLESLKKLPVKDRFEKIVTMRLEGKKLPEAKMVEALTAGWDEFEAMPKSLAESLKVEPVEELEEDVEDDDDESTSIRMITEDMDGEEIVEISDDELDDDDEVE